MLDVLRKTSEGVFVPLTVGGGIRGFTDANKQSYSALEVASAYFRYILFSALYHSSLIFFRAGADKVSIGSDAVYIVESFLRTGIKTGTARQHHLY